MIPDRPRRPRDTLTYVFEELPLFRPRQGLLNGALINGEATIAYDNQGDWWISGIALDCYFHGPQHHLNYSPIGMAPTWTKNPVALDKTADAALWGMIHATLIATCSEHIVEKIVDATDDSSGGYFEDERRLHVATESAAISRDMGR